MIGWIFILVPALRAADPVPMFEKDVLPVLTTYCFTCHGQSSPKLGLDLRSAASAMKGSHNGPVVIPGKPDDSLLWKKVSSRAMPPKIYGQTVPDRDLDVIKRWIEGGAPSDKPIGLPAKEAADQRARFQRELRPIFQSRCVQCHGEKSPAAGLSLLSQASVLTGGANGPVIVEGFSERSLLVRRVSNHTMPPAPNGKPLSEPEVRSIREWIDRGNFSEAVAAGSADRPFTDLEAPGITPEQRRHWAFQKPAAPPIPKVRARDRVRNPIDNLLLSKLESKGLSFSPEAPAGKLLRRAFLDLTGLTPTPEQVDEFRNDTAPGAYERLLDRLLQSPHYGERWGRDWLDAAGYVDTTGKDFDPTKTSYAEGMWRYRDYVIQSFNSDIPWNRFLTEQLAGDELTDWRSAKTFTPEIVRLLTATGYLRNILDITEEEISNLPVERYEALFKLVEKVSSSTLGLTVGCARCHSHKFDPIPQRDYYRFLALFTTSYNPTDWIQPQNRHLYTVSKAEKEAIDRHNDQFKEPIEKINKQIAERRKPYEKRLFDGKLAALPENIRDDVRSAIDTEAEKRDEVQKYLFARFNANLKAAVPEVNKLLSAGDKAAIADLNKELKAVQAKQLKLEHIQALWDVGGIPTIRLLQRGSADAPGPRVTPGFLDALTPGNTDAARPAGTAGESSGMRLALARWLTHPDHPLTARVAVNRIWQGHFGVGIAATPDNFGTTGSAPSNQELLDYLAVEFMKNGWSVKKLHKLIMMSSAYRQSTQQGGQPWLEKARTIDPANTMLWRMNLRRLDAESLRDSVMAAAGKLDPKAGGPPIALEMRPDGLQVVSSREPAGARYRRSVYLTHRRTYPVSFLGVFDYPIIDTNCARRVLSATPSQSLTLMNDPFLWDAARALAESVDGSVERAYQRALARPPSSVELADARQFLTAQQQAGLTAAKAFESFAQALLISNEFLYID